MLHRERQSTNRTDLSNLSTTDAYSPPWMKDLIMKKKEKLVDIVNAVTKQTLTRELDFSSPSSKSGKTSIGSNTSISTVAKSDVRLSTKAGSGAFTNCCLSCLSQGDSYHCSCESGLNSKKAVHLSNSSSNVNVPIVRSVSSSLVTGGPCSRCLVCQCIHCINHLRSDSNQCVNKSNQFCDSILKCYSSQINDEPISPGLVATRKKQILRKQSSESSFFPRHCCKCGSNTYALNNDNYWQSLVSENMIDDKIKDDSSEYFNNDRNHHHYEVIIDYKRSNSVNSSEKDSSISNGLDNDESEEREFEYKYGPGIVDKLKLKFLSISIQQQANNKLIYNKMKRYSSLENIAVPNDSRIYQSQNSIQENEQRINEQRLNRDKQSQANDLLPLLGKNSAVVNVRSITGGGNRANGNHLSHRLYIQHHNSKNIYNSNKSTPIVPLMKRAKSMETLLFQDDKDKGRQPLNCVFHHQLSMPETPISSHNDLLLVNENVLIIENTNSDINQCQNRSGDKCNQSTMKSASNLNNEPNDEMPKPDTVKTYKRIFEPINSTNGGENVKSGINLNNNNKTKNNYKKALPPTNGVKRKPPVLRATTKNATLKSQSTVNSSSLTIKSQPPVPQVLPSSPTVRSNANKTVVIEDHDKNNNNNNKSANTSVMTKPPIAPKRASLTSIRSNLTSGMSAAPIVKNIKMNGLNSNSDRVTQNSSNSNSITEKNIKIITSDALDRIRTSGTTMTFNGSQQSSTHCPISQKVPTTFDSSDNSVNNPKVNKPIANIKPFTQNNGVLKSENVNNCQSVIDDCNDHDLGHENTNEISIEMSIEEKANIQTVETNYINNNSNDDKENKESALQSVISDTTSDSRQSTETLKNENTLAVNDENVSPNSCDMVDSNKVEKIEDRTQTNDVLKPSLLLNTGVNNNSSTSSLWSQQTKKPANSSSTTIVFDFRGKDVKSNLAIQPVPFGVSTRKTSKKTPKDGSINTNGSIGDSDDDDDNYTGSLDIPLPSGIIFTGENVKVGKGSMLSTRNKKLNIQFNDSATSTYEYPSEASLLLDIPITNRSSSIAEPNGEIKSEINDSVIACESSNPITSLTTLKTNLALGGSSGGLASYKPTLIDTPFELGVSRTPKTHQKAEVLTNGNIFETDSEAKPANCDETTSWSTSSTASDLLF